MKSKMSFIAWEMIPGVLLLPDMVYVFPEPLCPYANTVPAQIKHQGHITLTYLGLDSVTVSGQSYGNTDHYECMNE